MYVRASGETPLLRWLRAASKVERERCAELAGTPVAYLYQLASPTASPKSKRKPRVGLALAISRATAVMHQETQGRLPVVLVDDLA